MTAYEQGFDLFKHKPDLTLGEVAWLGPKTLNEAIDFQKKEGGPEPFPHLR